MANNIFQKYALGAVLADSNEHDYDELLESFEQGECPDGVSIWAPFENHDYYELASLIEEQHDIFKAFAEELDERRGRGEE